jgi:hypothetical protein
MHLIHSSTHPPIYSPIHLSIYSPPFQIQQACIDCFLYVSHCPGSCGCRCEWLTVPALQENEEQGRVELESWGVVEQCGLGEVQEELNQVEKCLSWPTTEGALIWQVT